MLAWSLCLNWTNVIGFTTTTILSLLILKLKVLSLHRVGNLRVTMNHRDRVIGFRVWGIGFGVRFMDLGFRI